MSGQTDRFRVLRRLPEIRFEDELRGYSKSQVDRVLETLAPLADEVEALQQRLSEAETRAASAEARLVERTDRVDSIQRPQPPTSAPDVPLAPTPETPADFDETLRNTLLLAQRTADQTVRDAQSDADRLRAEAEAAAEEVAAAGRREADELAKANDERREQLDSEVTEERIRRLDELETATVERMARIESELTEAHDGLRQDLLAQIAELEATRDLLASDVDSFEAHLAGRREAVRSALAELEAVVDGNAALRGEMPPTQADIPITDPTAFGAIAVESTELASLQDDLTQSRRESDRPVGTTGLASDGVFADDGGPDPIAAGPATEAVDVLALDGDDHDDDDAHDTGDDGLPQRGPGQTAAFEQHRDDVETDAPAVADVIEADQAPVERPAWADAVPDAGEHAAGADSGDPFLDELRRVTDDDAIDEDDEALARFLEEDSGDDRTGGGWFGRKK